MRLGDFCEKQGIKLEVPNLFANKVICPGCGREVFLTPSNRIPRHRKPS